MILSRRVPRARVALAALALALGSANPAAAVGPGLGTPTASSTFARGIEFLQPVNASAGAVARAELLIDFPGEPGPSVRVVQLPTGSATLRYFFDTANGGLLPNTSLSARWRVVGGDGSVSLGPAVSVRYDDTRFAWKVTRDGPVVRVHWYQGSDAFAEHALQVGIAGIQRASDFLGVAVADPVDFFVYADQQAFYDALGPATRENVGGEAVPEIRTLFGLITPSQINDAWVGIVIPHELTHLVFDTAVRNPYHAPPRWLNEGLAVYLAQGYGASDRSTVDRAVAAGTLMPLTSLGAEFPTTRDRFALAYAESVSAVDYLVRQHGQPALVGLIGSYAGGVTDDEAFRAALGQDVTGFDAAWRASVNAGPAEAYGPKAAPAGPLPSDWLAAPGGTPAAIAPGGASSGPTDALGAPTTGAATAAPGQAEAPGSAAIPVLSVVAVVLGLVGLALLAVAMRARAGSGGPPRIEGGL